MLLWKRKAVSPYTLPRKLEKALLTVDWTHPDTLVGGLRTASQLTMCKKYRFYHVPVSAVPADAAQVRYIAIYQSAKLFGRKCGIRYYGKVTDCKTVPRCSITQIPKDSNAEYYLFSVKRWKRLRKSIPSVGMSVFHLLTHRVLLQHARSVPELALDSAPQWRLYRMLQDTVLHHARTPNKPIKAQWSDIQITVVADRIWVHKQGKLTGSLPVAQYLSTPLDAFGYLFPQL